MAVATRVTVATTGGGTAIYQNTGGRPVLLVVRNRGSVAVYLGGPNLTTSTGFQVDPGEAVDVRLAGDEALFGITASSSCVVHVLKVEA